MAYQDLRDFISALENRGLFKLIHSEKDLVDRKWNNYGLW